MHFNELDGVDFAILMGFASITYQKRVMVSVQEEFVSKLRTIEAKQVLKELIEPYGNGSDSAKFVRKVAGIPTDFQ